MRFRRSLNVLLATAVTLVLAFVLSAAPPQGNYRVVELKEAAPAPLTAEVRGALGKMGYRVSDPVGKAVCDVWLRAELPVIEKFQEQDDVKYPFEPGTLVGAIRFLATGSDYRKQSVKPGVYTLRYGHQPLDGNHLGTAQYRDFVVMVPAAEDKSPAAVTQEEAMDLSVDVSGTTHPAILSLLPPQKGREKLPTMAHEDTLKLEVLVAKTTGKLGTKTQDIQIELVAVGHAPE